MSTSKTFLPEQPAPLVVIVGPTAVGKTEIALQLAERLGAEIVSADSRLFYRGLDIGTAKPTPAEQARVPHHLIDIADITDTWSLPVFQQAAQEAIAGIHSRRRLPLLVGGTGQYVRAVMQGWSVPSQAPDAVLRAALERWAQQVSPAGLHSRLAVIDPLAAGWIDAHNVRRTIRALEVTLRTGKPFSAQRQQLTSPYSLLIVGLKRPRLELYQRVDQRIDAMVAAGFPDEVLSLLQQGYSPDLPALSAIGYREMVAYLKGRLTLEEACRLIKRLTRRFVRHQANWFKETDPHIHWFKAGPESVNAIEALVHSEDAWIPPGTPLAA